MLTILFKDCIKFIRLFIIIIIENLQQYIWIDIHNIIIKIQGFPGRVIKYYKYTSNKWYPQFYILQLWRSRIWRFFIIHIPLQPRNICHSIEPVYYYVSTWCWQRQLLLSVEVNEPNLRKKMSHEYNRLTVDCKIIRLLHKIVEK